MKKEYGEHMPLRDLSSGDAALVDGGKARVKEVDDYVVTFEIDGKELKLNQAQFDRRVKINEQFVPSFERFKRSAVVR